MNNILSKKINKRNLYNFIQSLNEDGYEHQEFFYSSDSDNLRHCITGISDDEIFVVKTFTTCGAEIETDTHENEKAILYLAECILKKREAH
jgi:hypothetical protein